VTRSRVFPRRTRPSPSLRPQLLRPRFRAAAGYYALDPRPCPPYASRCSRERPASASLDPTTPNDFCNFTSDARTHSRATVSRSIRAPRLCGDPEPAVAPTALLRAPWPSPVEEGPRRLRAVTTPPRPTPLRCKLATERDPGCHRPIATPLAGDASIRPPFAAMAVERQRWIARAEQPRVKDLPSRRLLPQGDEGEGSPPRSSYSSTPLPSPTLRTEGWILPPFS